jgi:proteasome lid subunit RPN8/RPN11
VHIDDLLLAKLAKVRESKLPNETGGVLVGGVDLRRKIVYVVDALTSPPDSVEWPNLYIRGWQGLPNELAMIEEATLGNLGYVGEWHSHPKGRGTRPSEDDVRLFGWLTDEMAASYQPPVMLIVGHAGKARLFVSSIPSKPPEPICLS